MVKLVDVHIRAAEVLGDGVFDSLHDFGIGDSRIHIECKEYFGLFIIIHSHEICPLNNVVNKYM